MQESRENYIRRLQALSIILIVTIVVVFVIRHRDSQDHREQQRQYICQTYNFCEDE